LTVLQKAEAGQDAVDRFTAPFNPPSEVLVLGFECRHPPGKRPRVFVSRNELAQHRGAPLGAFFRLADAFPGRPDLDDRKVDRLLERVDSRE